MGLLTRKDAKLHRRYFAEMCKLIGQSVGYQYVIKQEMTIHSEDNATLSMPQRIDALFDENPSTSTLNALGWVSENRDTEPVIINLPYDTPKLSVNARIIIETVDGLNRPRTYRITNIKADLEYPDAYTCMLAPVYDQYTQRNQYTLVNAEKMNQGDSARTSEDQPYKYITSAHAIDNTPEDYKKYAQQYDFINEQKSPYSG